MHITAICDDVAGYFRPLRTADASESRYDLAKREFTRADKAFTDAYVSAELVPLATTPGSSRQLVLELLSALIESRGVEIVWASPELHLDAHDLLLARLDKRYLLCDAVSFLLMHQQNDREALTTDCHFEQESFVTLLR